MKLYAARHGKTDWNALDRIQGRTDNPLNDQGVAQASLLGENCRDLGIDLIISSPMIRALDTAKAVALTTGAPIIIDDRLIEQNYGIYEGQHRFCDGFLQNKRQFAYKYPGGESMMMLAQRVYNFLDEVKENYSDKTVMVVCHGGVLRALHTYFYDLTNDEYFSYNIDNAVPVLYEL
ncbi:MAG: histidine phosphatase family protein [Ruminococcaceae bacterium]|nr:histidine phosphatase family protein [Oscillospiraceae bacterium]